MRRHFYICLWVAAAILAVSCKSGPSVPDGPRVEVKRGPVQFSIAEISGLMSYVPDSVPWNQYVMSNEMSGPVLYLLKPGLDNSMGTPHIRMDYVAKSAPNSASVDEVFGWLVNWYNSDGRTSQVMNDKESITTADGQEVRLLEISKPEHISTSMGDGSAVAAKKVAYAYIDNGDGYWIGACLTVSQDLRDYDPMMDQFRQLIASFKAGPGK